MLTITEAANSYLAGLMKDQEVPDGLAIRFIWESEGIDLRLDTPGDDDIKFEHQGRTIVIMDEELAELLTDKTLDVDKDDEGEMELELY